MMPTHAHSDGLHHPSWRDLTTTERKTTCERLGKHSHPEDFRRKKKGGLGIHRRGGGGGGEARAMIRAMTEAKWRRSWLKGVWSDDKCSMANYKGRVEGEHNTVRGLASQD